jgi:hypothetical protein
MVGSWSANDRRLRLKNRKLKASAAGEQIWVSGRFGHGAMRVCVGEPIEPRE